MNVAHMAVGLFNASWQSTALILTTALGLRACRNVGARARCTLWSAVFFLSALLPIADLAMQRTLVVAPHGPQALPARATALLNPPSQEVLPAPTRGNVRGLVLDEPAARRPLESTRSSQPARPEPRENLWFAPQRAFQSLAGALLALYLLGVLFFAVRLARECVALLALKRRCSVVQGDPFLLGQLPRNARLATSEEIAIPCVLGFVRPLVVLPADMIGQVTPADLRRVVGHEAAHLERYDDWTNLIEQVVLAAFFYNPAMHFANRQIATEREIACDDRVVMHEGDTVTYAECLATLVHRAGCSSRRLPVPGFHAGPRQIVVRIERLLDRAYSRSRRFGVGIAVTAGAVLLLAVTGVGNTLPVLSDAIAPVPALASLSAAAPNVAPAAKAAAVMKVAAVPQAAATTVTIVRIAKDTREETRMLVAQGAPPAPRATPAPVSAPAMAPIPSMGPMPTMGPVPPMTAPMPSMDPLRMKRMQEMLAAPMGPTQMKAMRELMQRMQGSPERRALLDGMAQRYVASYDRHGDSLIDALSASGYGRLSVDELVSLSDRGVSGTAVREYARLFGHPTIDELKELADHGVSPRYIEALRAAGLHSLSVHDAVRLADSGISSREVENDLRILRAAPSVDDIIRLHNSGVE